MTSFAIGLTTGLTLIVAIGSQNAFVLRLGISHSRVTVLAVVLVCALSDAVLITAGVLGVGAVIEAVPTAMIVVRVLGAAFLIGYGVLALRRALTPSTHQRAALTPEQGGGISMSAAILTSLALTWLNPHVYLDTVILLGSLANQQPDGDKWWWVGGAITASFFWFFSLGFSARLLRPFFARPSSWRILDGLIAVVMLTLGITLAVGQ